MGQPSTSEQIRAVALREAVASVDEGASEQFLIKRAEAFASFIEHGVEVDHNA